MTTTNTTIRPQIKRVSLNQILEISKQKKQQALIEKRNKEIQNYRYIDFVASERFKKALYDSFDSSAYVRSFVSRFKGSPSTSTKRVKLPLEPPSILKWGICEGDEDSDDSAYALSAQDHVFSTRNNEIDIENGSTQFDAFRQDKMSASKIGGIAGLSKLFHPAMIATTFYHKGKSQNVYSFNGIVEEPRTRLAVIRSAPHVAFRKCGIFTDQWDPHSYTSMPDDIGALNGIEFALEYKFIAMPFEEHLRPHADHLAQVTWQLAHTQSELGFLIYSLGHAHCIKDIKLAVWRVEFSPHFYWWLRERAAIFRLFLDNPTYDNLPDFPWLGGHAQATEAWLNRQIDFESLLGIPPPPPFKSVNPREIGY